jgi:hypothetical protein
MSRLPACCIVSSVLHVAPPGVLLSLEFAEKFNQNATPSRGMLLGKNPVDMSARCAGGPPPGKDRKDGEPTRQGLNQVACQRNQQSENHHTGPSKIRKKNGSEFIVQG